MLPDIRQQQAENKREKRRGDRHEALTGEETEEFRQLHRMEAVIAPRRENTADKPAENPHLQRRDANDHGVFSALRGHLRGNAEHSADGDVGDKDGNGCRQRSDARF